MDRRVKNWTVSGLYYEARGVGSAGNTKVNKTRWKIKQNCNYRT